MEEEGEFFNRGLADIADDLDVSSFVEWPEKISAKACEAFSGKKFLIKIERTEKKGEREIEFCEQ